MTRAGATLDLVTIVLGQADHATLQGLANLTPLLLPLFTGGGVRDVLTAIPQDAAGLAGVRTGLHALVDCLGTLLADPQVGPRLRTDLAALAQ